MSHLIFFLLLFQRLFYFLQAIHLQDQEFSSEKHITYYNWE